MAELSVLTWIGNAAAVTTQTQRAGCSRQAADEQARRVHQAVSDLHAGGPCREELLRELERQRDEDRQLWAAFDRASTSPRRSSASSPPSRPPWG